MITIPHRSGQNIAVLGLGASGRATVAALSASGVKVAAWDDSDASRGAVGDAAALRDLYAADWSGFDALVLSPGIPLTHPAPHRVAQSALDAGVPVIGDIELLAEAQPEASFVAITGTNGKSTTTALIGHVLTGAGRRVEIGGNLGEPALSLEPLGAAGIYVLELSSYQLDLTQEARFDIAVLLNITPDHLDRHGEMEGYVAAKRRIFRTRGPAPGKPMQTAVIGVDDEHGRHVTEELINRSGWRVIPISNSRAVAGGVYAIDGVLFADLEGKANSHPVCDLSQFDRLPGRHNWQNACAAFAACRIAGVAVDGILDAFRTFPGLPHRQELVATLKGIRYVNDSKATNGEAAARALACYETIYWIAGGIAKEDGLDPTGPYLDRVRRAFLIGRAAEPFAEFLRERGREVEMCGDLATALAAAHALAQKEGRPGAAVLLSPACASFDQWANFEARGDGFRRIVRQLRAEGAQ